MHIKFSHQREKLSYSVLASPFGRALIIFLAVLIRLIFLPKLNYDLHTFETWYQYILSNGGFSALADSFTNYPPLYSYLLLFMTKLEFIHPFVAIKLIPSLCDFIAAYIVLRIVKLYFPSGVMPWKAYFAFLFTPIVFVTSGYWGQCDVIYVTFLLACVYFLLLDRPWPAMLFLSLALSTKVMAIFITPLIFVLMLKKRIPWATLILPPFVYTALCIPAWLAGRPLMNMLLTYFTQNSQQIGANSRLSLNAPNFYSFIDDRYFSTVLPIGLAVTFLLVMTYIFFSFKSKFHWNSERLLFEATLILILFPSILPAMAERYFYPAAIVGLVLALYAPQYRLAAVALQASSLLAYLPFLRGYPLITVNVGAVLNLVLLIWLFTVWLRQYVMLEELTYPVPSESGGTG